MPNYKEVVDWKTHLDTVLTENLAVGDVNDFADDVEGGTEQRRCRCSSRIGERKCTDETCHNRGTQTECDPEKCGPDCVNNRFQFNKFANLAVVDCGEKGYGLVSKHDLVTGDLVYEYFGELINGQELARRRQEVMQKRHLFMLELKPGRGSEGAYLDSTNMGGMSRFVNHSCEPNCSMSVWIVQGRYRCGIFAAEPIPEGTELTFDYSWEPSPDRPPTVCHCGSKRCRGYIEVFSKLDSQDLRFKSGVWRSAVEARDEAAMCAEADGTGADDFASRSSDLQLGQFLQGKRVRIWNAELYSHQEADVLVYEEHKNLFHVRYLLDKEVKSVSFAAKGISDNGSEAQGSDTEVAEGKSKDAEEPWLWLDESAKEQSIQRRAVSLAEAVADAEAEASGGQVKVSSERRLSSSSSTTRPVAPQRVRRTIKLSEAVGEYMLKTSGRTASEGSVMRQVSDLISNMFAISCFLESDSSVKQRSSASTTPGSSNDEELGLFGDKQYVEDAIKAIAQATDGYVEHHSSSALKVARKTALAQSSVLTADWRHRISQDAEVNLQGLSDVKPKYAKVAPFQDVPSPHQSYPKPQLPPSLEWDGILCHPCGALYDDNGATRQYLGASVGTRKRMNSQLARLFSQLRKDSYYGSDVVFDAVAHIQASTLLQRLLCFMTDAALDKTSFLLGAAVILAVKSRGRFRWKFLRRVTLQSYCIAHGRDIKDKSIIAILPVLQERTVMAESAAVSILRQDIFVPDILSCALSMVEQQKDTSISQVDVSLEECMRVAASVMTAHLVSWHCLLPELATIAAALCLPVLVCHASGDTVISGTRHPPTSVHVLCFVATHVFDLNLDDVADTAVFFLQNASAFVDAIKKEQEFIPSSWCFDTWPGTQGLPAVESNAIISPWIDYSKKNPFIKRRMLSTPSAGLSSSSHLRTRVPWLDAASLTASLASDVNIKPTVNMDDTELIRKLTKGTFAAWIPETTLNGVAAGHINEVTCARRTAPPSATAGAFVCTPSREAQRAEDKRERGVLREFQGSTRKTLQAMRVATNKDTLQQLTLLQQIHYATDSGAYGYFGVPLAVARGPAKHSTHRDNESSRTTVRIDDDEEEEEEEEEDVFGISKDSFNTGREGSTSKANGSEKVDTTSSDNAGDLDALLLDDQVSSDKGYVEDVDMNIITTTGSDAVSTEFQTANAPPPPPSSSSPSSPTGKQTSRIQLTYLVMPASQVYLPLSNILPSHNQSSGGRLSHALAQSLCANLVSALLHCVERGLYLQYLQPDELYVSSTGRLVLAGLSGGVYASVATEIFPKPAMDDATLSSSSSSSHIGVEFPALSYTAPEVICGAPPSLATTSFACVSMCTLLLTGKPAVKDGASPKKHMQYIYRVLGTPRKEECTDFYQALPRTAQWGMLVTGPDGSRSDSRNRVLKVLSSLVPASSKIEGLPHTDASKAPKGMAAFLAGALTLDPSRRSSIMELFHQAEEWPKCDTASAVNQMVRAMEEKQLKRGLLDDLLATKTTPKKSSSGGKGPEGTSTHKRPRESGGSADDRSARVKR